MLRLYRTVCDMQPYAAHGWLELSKLEEDCGRQVDAVLVVRQGLDFCTLSDACLQVRTQGGAKVGRGLV